MITSTDSTSDSWVEVQFPPSTPQPLSPQLSSGQLVIAQSGSQHSEQECAFEQLLRDAQRDANSGRSSLLQSGNISPVSGECCSPAVFLVQTNRTSPTANVELMQNNTDWLWDWSSHSVAAPVRHKRLGCRSKQQQHNLLSLRKSCLMRQPQAANSHGRWYNGGSSAVLSLLTHAASFIVGAAAVFVILKNHSKHRSIVGH